MKTIIGLTGPTGSGKSYTAALAAQEGFDVIDCDAVCHRVYETSPLCRQALQAAFGRDVVSGETVDRAALAQKAFADAAATKKLNETVLPYVATAVLEEIDRVGDRVLLDAPTLFESGLDELCGGVLAVVADESVRLERIMRRDGLDEAAARRRMAAGKPESYYRERTAYVLVNNQDARHLELAIKAALQQITKECSV